MPLFALVPPPPLPQPPPAIVRTAEELGIDLKTHYEPPKPPPPPLLPGTKIAMVAETVLGRYQAGDRSPSYGPICFRGAAARGNCQRNVRDLIEASVYGRHEAWAEAACCAGQTQRNLHASALKGRYIEITDIEQLRQGDLVYLSGGYHCSKCGGEVGHAMVCMGRRKDGNLMMWQNTSYGGHLLCKIPLVEWQSKRFIAGYRFPAPKPKVEPAKTPVRSDTLLTIVERPRVVGLNSDPMMRSVLDPGIKLMDVPMSLGNYMMQHESFRGMMAER